MRGQGPADEVNALLDAWHHAAAVADEAAYFGVMDSSAVYLGTDPGEHWSTREFHEWARPQFARGSAWAFTPYGRTVTVAPGGDIAWFDEKLKWFDTRLHTWMTGLRGSGVVRRASAGWRLVQYNLSLEIPNDRLPDVVADHGAGRPPARALRGRAVTRSAPRHLHPVADRFFVKFSCGDRVRHG